jgi:DNA polymerase
MMHEEVRMYLIRLDYETRSRADISAGGYEYALDPSTRVACLAARVVGPTGSVSTVVERFDLNGPRQHPMPPVIAAAVAAGARVRAFNVAFEQVIWRHVLGWPEPAGWDCTMALCAVNALPQSLQGAAEFLGLPGKHDAGYKVMKRVCIPARKTGEFVEPTEQDWTDLLAYCLQDVETEEAIEAKAGPFPACEEAVWRACNAINQRGVLIDRQLCEAAVQLVQRIGEACDADVRQATSGAITGSDLTRVEYLLTWINSRGVDMEEMTAAAIAGALRRKTLPADVKAVLEARRKIARASVKKLQAMLDGSNHDGRLRGQFRYCGAQTGRWKSRGEETFFGRDGNGVQLQNLPKPPDSMKREAIREALAATLANDLPRLVTAGGGEADAALVSLVRPAIVAGPGKVFAVVDYASIEARGALWLAQDWPHLKWFSDYDAKRGADPYCAMAAKTVGRPVTKADKMERQLGKVQVLGAGYGMGEARFIETAVAPPYNLPREYITPIAPKAIQEYRTEFASLAGGWRYDDEAGRKQPYGLWSRLDHAAKQALQYQERVDVGPLTFGPGRFGDLALRLPSGRVIRYHKPRIVKGEKFGNDQVQYTDLRANHPVDMYGGKWLENATQALCRDLLADAMVRLESYGFTVVMHVHDELVCEVSVPDAANQLAYMEQAMREVPKWATGFPIAVEGFLTSRYGKESF